MSSLRKLHSDTDDAIEAAASAWLVERDVGFTPEQAAEFERWKHADPRHAAAIAMLEETRGLLEKMPLLRNAPALHRRMESLQQGAPNRRKVIHFSRALRTVAALAACIALAVGIWWVQVGSRGAVEEISYATLADEYRNVVLPDRSVMELNGSTNVRVQFSRAQRRISLTAGEAHFTVEKDAARPFVVSAASVGIRAVGTAFTVKLEPESVEVLVTEGRVQVARESQSSTVRTNESAVPGASIFSAGQRVVVATHAAAGSIPEATAIDPSTTAQALAWRNPLLTFVETPLAEVVQKFNRHNRVQLEVGDAELRDHAVGGTFRAQEVESFVRLLEKIGEVSVERPTRERIILRPVAPAQRPSGKSD